MEQRHDLDTGSLRVDEMRALLESMPADITFSDADNIIRFYTGRYRIFDRGPENIGTSVIDCHSPASWPTVEKLIRELASGERDDAVFPTEKNGRPVHVRYMPVRDGDGVYLGVLEVCQYTDDLVE
jgi:hypothetical protein